MKKRSVKLPPRDMPLWNTEGMLWDKVVNTHIGHHRFDGSSKDYWSYLRAVESLVAPLQFQGQSRVGLTSSVKIPPILLQQVNIRYWLRQCQESRYYLLNSDVVDALHSTDLTWIDAEAFASIPDAFGIIIEEPSDSFGIFASSPTGDWHAVSDLLLLRVKDLDNRERICDNLKVDSSDPSNQVFYWVAGSRDGLVEGRGSMNWGLFCVGENMKLDHLLDGLERFSKEMAARESEIVPAKLRVEASRKSSLQSLANDMSQTMEAMHYDYTEGQDKQRTSMLSCVEFLAKAVLMANCEWFEKAAIAVPPPGVKALPHKARQLWEDYGHRYRVTLPPADSNESTAQGHPLRDGERHGPIRHWVHGFFRSQPFGVGRTGRKIMWIRGFWRGKLAFQQR